MIGIVSLLPGPDLPPLPPYPGADKVAHVAFYLPLGFLLARSLRSPGNLTLVILALLIGLYGYSLEVGQLYVPGRSYDLLDALANLAGGALGVGAAEMWIHRRFEQPG